mmetsp:Transcript_31384/g.86281  ORF Transcript_31384/g.86281 Transcript_31384/m.86281 type:complete len:261 (-) Transcript_31384:655-1437(-)
MSCALRLIRLTFRTSIKSLKAWRKWTAPKNEKENHVCSPSTSSARATTEATRKQSTATLVNMAPKPAKAFSRCEAQNKSSVSMTYVKHTAHSMKKPMSRICEVSDLTTNSPHCTAERTVVRYTIVLLILARTSCTRRLLLSVSDHMELTMSPRPMKKSTAHTATANWSGSSRKRQPGGAQSVPQTKLSRIPTNGSVGAAEGTAVGVDVGPGDGAAVGAGVGHRASGSVMSTMRIYGPVFTVAIPGTLLSLASTASTKFES